MKKSFKKAIAVLLTVLMVVCSMPFTALAAIGDYQPDLRLQFGTFYASGGTNWVDYSKGAVSGADFSMCGLYDVPVDFNYTLNKTTGAVSGTLYIDKDKANKANEVLKYDNLTENLVLGVGDYFQVTLIADDINKLCEWSSYVTYSNNIEPAGYYSYKSGRNTKYAVGTVSECTAAGGTMSLGGYSPIAGQSGTDLYPGINKEFGDPATSEGGAMFCELSIQDGSDYYDLAGGLHNDYYADPATGDLNGYTYTNCMIINTFVFKITGEGDITFALEDTDGSKYAGFVGGKYRADDAEGNATSCYTTYAVNSAGNADGSENAGSRKMTFMGYNVNVGGGEEACTHTNTEVRNKVDATCTTDGYTGDTVCLACGETIATGTKIPATGHTPVSADNAVAATCTTDGKEADTVCSVCGVTLTTGATINKLGHNYTSVVTTEATCTEAGVTTWTCTRCGDSYTTNEPAAKGHTEGEIPAVEATCTTDGATAGTKCSVCGEILVAPQKIDKLGHDYTSAVTTEPTCTTAGVTTWTCTRCGDSYTTEEPAAKGHTEVEIPAVEATCTTDGATAGVKCSVCDEILEAPQTINKLGHDFSVVVSSTAGDCQTVGTTTYKCSRCDATKVVDGAYGPHTEVEIPAVEATCTTDGATAGTKCSVCGEILEAPQTIDKLGHDYVDVENSAVAPTCTVAGKEADQRCSRCGDVSTGAEIPATGHTEVEIPAVEATCTTDGATAGTKCSVCGEILEAPQTIDATGHTAGDPVETTIKEATCTEKGEKNTTVTCTVCGATISSVNEEISETGHTPGEPVVETVPATVDAKGSITTTVSCTVCGAELSKDVQEIPMLASYDVTVERTDLGTVTLNGADVTEGATVKVEAGKTFTLTATPVDGANFLGWKANGATTVSTAKTFKTTALADVTYTPVFEIENEGTFTVQFVDAFGNIVSAQQVGSGAEINIPTAPTRPGYEAATENGWSMTNDEITALEASATITAQYTKAEEALYTITATGCDITANGETVKDTVSVAYDTKVTVTSAGATAWKVNGVDGVTVGYGESYTFFVTANIELVPVTNAVVETPQVANVGVGTIGATGKIQAVFKATRTMTDDCKYISSGFVYGNGDLGEITLDDVNGSAVKAAYTKTSVEQFTLTYGLRAQSGTITARAFLAYVDANGNNTVIYADPMTYTYNK